MSGFADDYIQVNQRIEAFYRKYPEGSLQSELIELSETRVVMRGIAYRSPDDPRPGIGTSALSIPGKTPYTRDSEIENAETSAWGRALAALGFEVKRAIASAEEVHAKATTSAGATTEPQQPAPAPRGRSGSSPAPASPRHTWNVGDVHAEGHRPLGMNKRGLYCPTKTPDGWCSFTADAAPKPHPLPADDEPPMPSDDEFASLAAMPF